MLAAENSAYEPASGQLQAIVAEAGGRNASRMARRFMGKAQDHT
jgi:hypothetical protein